MNTMPTETDTETLSGRRILFVEDRPDTLEFFFEALREAAGQKIDIDYATTFGEAISKISTAVPAFDLVVIDLLMPGEFPEELKAYSERLVPDLNEGQTLGLWLHKEYPDTPYLYLSSVPEAYKFRDDDTPEPREPVNKFLESPVDLPKRVAKILRDVRARRAQ